jgi:hypothetical protein
MQAYVENLHTRELHMRKRLYVEREREEIHPKG